MVKVVVGSQNPVKIMAVQEAFAKFFNAVDVTGTSVPSNVPDQPFHEQTYEGAQNRAQALRQLHPSADFYVGIEGGVTCAFAQWFSWGSICVVDNAGKISFGNSPGFQLPVKIVEELQRGTELGAVMDKMVEGHDTKQKQGAIGILSKGVLDRKNLYIAGLIAALVPFVNQKLYFPNQS